MKNKLVILSMCLFVTLSFTITGCNDHDHGVVKSDAASVTYTCPMHPQIVQDKEGTCPVCGMDLVVFDRTGTDKSLSLHKSQVALANITTMVVGDTSISRNRRLNGRVVADPSATQVISARVPGRIEKLYFKETGVGVKKGQLLYTIFSEELASLQQEYLLAAAQKKEFPGDEQFANIERAARQKLILYGQSDAQIMQLKSEKKAIPYTGYPSPVSGVVAEIVAAEGAYVNEGGVILRLEDYSKVWIEADVYPSDRNLVKEGMKVMVEFPENTSAIQTSISFINPELSNGTQLTKVRAAVKSENMQLRPGMQASIVLPTGSTSPVMSLPTGAVIRDGEGAHVWVQTADGKYEPREVQPGKEDAQQVEILEGINSGDKIVITGAYLLYSEFVLKKGSKPTSSNHEH